MGELLIFLQRRVKMILYETIECMMEKVNDIRTIVERIHSK